MNPKSSDVIKSYIKEENFTAIRNLVYKFSESPYQGVIVFLCYAVEIGNLEVVKYIVSLGVDPLEHDDLALYCAVKNGHLEITKFLVSLGAAPHAHFEQHMINAASEGHLEIVKYIVSLGGDPNDFQGLSLVESAINGHIEVVKYLLSKNALIYNYSFLKNVVENRHFEILKLILSHCNAHNFIFKWSIEKGDLESVKYLVSLGADDIHTRNIFGDSSFTLAAQFGHLNVVKYLVSQGVYIHTDYEKATLISIYYDHNEVAEYLLSLGVDINVLIQNDYYPLIYKNKLKKYIKVEYYKGPLNDQTETVCAICLTEMDCSVEDSIIQCKTCKKCVHKDCQETWGGKCIYCRN